MKSGKPKPIKFRQSLFWDVDPETIDPEKHARYVIERILDFGFEDEVRWMAHYYPEDVIKEVIIASRVLSKPSRDLWRSMFGMEAEEESESPRHCNTCRCFEKTTVFIQKSAGADLDAAIR